MSPDRLPPLAFLLLLSAAFIRGYELAAEVRQAAATCVKLPICLNRQLAMFCFWLWPRNSLSRQPLA